MQSPPRRRRSSARQSTRRKTRGIAPTRKPSRPRGDRTPPGRAFHRLLQGQPAHPQGEEDSFPQAGRRDRGDRLGSVGFPQGAPGGLRRRRESHPDAPSPSDGEVRKRLDDCVVPRRRRQDAAGNARQSGRPRASSPPPLSPGGAGREEHDRAGPSACPPDNPFLNRSGEAGTDRMSVKAAPSGVIAMNRLFASFTLALCFGRVLAEEPPRAIPTVLTLSDALRAAEAESQASVAAGLDLRAAKEGTTRAKAAYRS